MVENVSWPDDARARAGVEAFLCAEFGAAKVTISQASLLSGGAIQENWAVDLDVDGGNKAGLLKVVLRTDSPTGLAVSHSRAQEFELLQAAWNAGVTVPEPLACTTDTGVLGKEFSVMRRVGGTAIGQKITRDLALGGNREKLTEQLGREMALIHSITPDSHRFDFLGDPPADPAVAELATMRRFLDDMGYQRPVLELVFRWLEKNLPKPDRIVLAHHDFRTGNYMVDENGLTAILDWEFAGWSDPCEDIGWFHAMCWRFSGRDRPAGGVGSREDFSRGYQSVGSATIDWDRVFYWEVFAHLRWAVIALQQGDRFLKGGERTLDLGLTGRRPAEMELEMLRMIDPDRTNSAGIGGN